MKMTNCLLIILIAVILGQKFSAPNIKPVISEEKKSSGIVIGKTVTETKTIKPTVLQTESTKHATTFRNYIDTNGRQTISASHSIRIGKEYYISSGVSARQTSYGSDSVGVDLSLTKFW